MSAAIAATADPDDVPAVQRSSRHDRMLSWVAFASTAPRQFQIRVGQVAASTQTTVGRLIG
jgi:hypothetical protein